MSKNIDELEKGFLFGNRTHKVPLFSKEYFDLFIDVI